MIIYDNILLSYFLVIMIIDIDNNKPKAFPLRGTTDMEHTPFYLHSHPLKHKKTHKQDSKQKAFNLRPLWASSTLQVSVVIK